MKKISDFFIFTIHKKNGFAIVLTLGAIALLSIIVLAFIQSVKNERLGSHLYTKQMEARRASISALNLVIAQIQEASKSTDGVWTSQPGLIRVHTGINSQRVYKLYSSDPKSLISNNYNAETDNLGFGDSNASFVDINSPVFNEGEKIYPILDPSILSGGKSQVDGFENTAGSSDESFRMNVRWIYQLTDGKLVTHDQLDKNNPPVARFAFWTDDESCKVNVNTASEGVYWDIPFADSKEDLDYSLKIPTLNEFQRYPGHPATTSLSPIFTSRLLGSNFSKQGTEYQDLIYSIVPRIASGGSKGGTVNGTTAVVNDSDRLFGSVSELAFKPTPSSTSRERSLISGDAIKKLPFFVTTKSRAPEETIFSTPRVTIWPLHTNTSFWTAAEKMIAFCSKINGNIYYFQRQKANDSKYDYESIPRNFQLYQYLQGLIQRPAPHFSKSLSSSWQNDSDQILTQIFDYIRSGPALQHPTFEKSYTSSVTSSTSKKFASGSVSPIVIGNTKGFGRSFTPVQAGVVVTNIRRNPTNVALPFTSMDVGLSFFVQLFSTNTGLTGYSPHGIDVKVAGLNGVTLQGKTGFSSDSGWQSIGSGNVGSLDWSYFAGFLPITSWLSNEELLTPGVAELFAWTPKTYGSNIFTCEVNVTAINGLALTGNNLTITLRDRSSGSTLQTISITIPSTIIDLAPNNLDNATGTIGLGNNGSSWRFQKYFPYAPANGGDNLKGLFIAPKNAAALRTDVVRSVIPSASSFSKGDFRLIAGSTTVPSNWFEKSPGSTASSYDTPTDTLVHDFKVTIHNSEQLNANFYATPGGSNLTNTNEGRLVASANYPTTSYSNFYRPQVYRNLLGAFNINNHPGDFDNGIGNFGDGPFLNKPDESIRTIGTSGSTVVTGNEYSVTDPTIRVSRGIHFARNGYNQVPDTLSAARAADATVWYSPNRQMPSPVMFGSLPTGVKRVLPWQTLLFCPNSSADCDVGSKVHPGWGKNGAPDHLILDFFRMPVAEPYAISDPFSTSGKININFEILPFKNLKRATGIHALLKSVKLGAIPTTEAPFYKGGNISSGNVRAVSYRSEINLDATVKSFEEKFATNTGVYRTDSEITEVFLYPSDINYNTNKSALYQWWKNRSITGDNTREKPYLHMHPRITTRSNVFTVHVIAQSLKKSKDTNPTKWDEELDRVWGEYRGSYMIERYIDPKDSKIKDYATSESTPLSSHYQFRVIQSKQFIP